MPQMPDPVSTCPIFDRIGKISKKSANVAKALAMLDNKDPLVDVGANNAFKVLEKTKDWKNDQGDDFSDVTYLTDLWFHKWPTLSPWKDDPELPTSMATWLTELIQEALQRSYDYSLANSGKSCPVLGFWECVGSGFDGASALGSVKKKPVIMLRIKTPAPPQEVEEI